MDIQSAIKYATENGCGIVRLGGRFFQKNLVIYPTNTIACCVMVMKCGSRLYVGPRWNPTAEDLAATDWTPDDTSSTGELVEYYIEHWPDYKRMEFNAPVILPDPPVESRTKKRFSVEAFAQCAIVFMVVFLCVVVTARLAGWI